MRAQRHRPEDPGGTFRAHDNADGRTLRPHGRQRQSLERSGREGISQKGGRPMTPVATKRQLETVKAVIDAYIASESSKFYGASDRQKHLTEFVTDRGSLRVNDLRADVLRDWVE